MLAQLDGRPLLAHTIERVRPQVADLALNGDGGAYDAFNLPVFADVVSGKLGPLAGILTAMEWVHGLGHERVLTVSGDTPFVPDTLVEALSQTPINTIALPQVDGRTHQICGLWPRELAGALRAFLQVGESYRVRDFLQQHETANVEFSKSNDIDPFFNVNTRADMESAEAVIRNRSNPLSSRA